MDLVAGAREVWAVMEHVDRGGRPKIVEQCTFPLTGRQVVTRVYTDLAIFHIADGRLRRLTRQVLPSEANGFSERLMPDLEPRQ